MSLLGRRVEENAAQFRETKNCGVFRDQTHLCDLFLQIISMTNMKFDDDRSHIVDDLVHSSMLRILGLYTISRFVTETYMVMFAF